MTHSPTTTAPGADASATPGTDAAGAPGHAPFRPADRSPDELAALAALLRADPARPVHLDGFLPDEQAWALGETVRALPTWEASAVLWNPDRLATRPATPEEWRAAAPEERAAVREVARGIPALFDDGSPYPAEHRARLSDFFVFAGMGTVLRELLDRWTAPGGPLTTNIEFARYRSGDTLGEHSDAESDTVFVLNLYLDPAYRAGDGGVLGFRDEEGREHLMPPRFNSVSVMPIRPGCVHWVTPWRADRVGRHTISIAAVPATPGEVK
ncbi:2OG-Fe(II) oxygenase [Streptomyces sp. P9-A4]|uniref:2OG-Fe(II) oxygenase n=1 Tax=Streptomyces sp. P9-A4 TaxID=3072285 RepID=UPI002FC5C11D